MGQRAQKLRRATGWEQLNCSMFTDGYPRGRMCRSAPMVILSLLPWIGDNSAKCIVKVLSTFYGQTEMDVRRKATLPSCRLLDMTHLVGGEFVVWRYSQWRGRLTCPLTFNPVILLTWNWTDYRRQVKPTRPSITHVKTPTHHAGERPNDSAKFDLYEGHRIVVIFILSQFPSKLGIRHLQDYLLLYNSIPWDVRLFKLNEDCTGFTPTIRGQQ